MAKAHNNIHLFFTLSILILLTATLEAQTTFYGEPYGYVKTTATAGTGSAKKISLISIPLLGQATLSGRTTGVISSASGTTITCNQAGWAPGELSDPAAPYILEITSGGSQGRMLLLSTTIANTTDTVHLDSSEAVRTGDLASLALEGNTFIIRPIDTLQSFFGTPESSLIQGGSSPNNADTITIANNGSAQTYFYNTEASPPRWSRVALGSPDASNTPIPPYSGIQYARVANTPLEFFTTGIVPSQTRQVAIKNSGITIMSSHWTENQTLSGLQLSSIDNWSHSNSPLSADKITVAFNGSAASYFHNGSNWRRVSLGTPISDTTQIPPGSSIIIQKRGESPGYSIYTHNSPYTTK